MSRSRTRRLITSSVFAVTALALTHGASAQPMGPGMMGQGMMMGPGAWSRGMQERMCGPSAAGFAEWRMERLDQLLKPTEAQRAKFEEFKAASAKAAEAMRGACPTSIPLTVTGRMEAMEKRTEAMLAAIKTVRPALAAFYDTLSDEQKTILDSGEGRRRFWRWRDHW